MQEGKRAGEGRDLLAMQQATTTTGGRVSNISCVLDEPRSRARWTGTQEYITQRPTQYNMDFPDPETPFTPYC
jgi:hypothetical protein